MFCTYLTIYSGNLLPPFYIGYTSKTNIARGYRGSVSSVKYKKIWKLEINENPHLFKTIVLRAHETKTGAVESEYRLLSALKVHKNPLYINMGIGGKNFHYDRTGMTASEETRKKMSEKRLGMNHSDETKSKMSESHRGKKLSDKTKSKIGKFHLGKIETLETRRKKSKTRTGMKHSAETKSKLSSNSGRSIKIIIGNVEYTSMKSAGEILFPDVSKSIAKRKIQKIRDSQSASFVELAEGWW